MRNKKLKILAFTIILSFSLTCYVVHTAYSQGGDYFTSYFPTYYLSWLYDAYGIQTPTYSHSSLYAMTPDTPQARRRATNSFNMFYTQPELFEAQSVHYGGMMYGYDGLVDGVQDGALFLRSEALITDGIFNQIYGNYQSMVNPLTLFNQPYASIPVISDSQNPKVSIQNCLQERPDLDTSRCIMFHRNPSLSVYTGKYPVYTENIMGSPFQLSAIPSTDYLSLYFICFEGCE